MLGELDVQATIPVRDKEEATRFYGGVLGLRVVHEDDFCITFESGNNSHLGVYLSDNAGTNQGISATWDVDDIEGLVRELRGEGVGFERYESFTGEEISEDGIFAVGDRRAAWFRDPFGNILCIRTMVGKPLPAPSKAVVK